MTGHAPAIVTSRVAEQRLPKFRVEAEHYRLARLAEQRVDRHVTRPDLTVVVVVVVLALLLKVGSPTDAAQMVGARGI